MRSKGGLGPRLVSPVRVKMQATEHTMESVVPGQQLRGCYPAKRNPASCPAGVLSESTSAWFRASDLPVCGLGHIAGPASSRALGWIPDPCRMGSGLSGSPMGFSRLRLGPNWAGQKT